MDKAKLLIDEIANMELVPQIQPHIFTEPFVNQDLREVVRPIKAARTQSYLNLFIHKVREEPDLLNKRRGKG